MGLQNMNSIKTGMKLAETTFSKPVLVPMLRVRMQGVALRADILGPTTSSQHVDTPVRTGMKLEV